MTNTTAPLLSSTDTTPSLVHAFCPACTAPVFGQTILALCGTPKVYLGHNTTALLDCTACDALAATWTGHCSRC